MDYTCTCDEGYEGRNCETDTDDCVSVLCGGHGTCLDGLASFTCSCETGYSGELCEELGECGVRRGRGRGRGGGGGAYRHGRWLGVLTRYTGALYCCCNVVMQWVTIGDVYWNTGGGQRMEAVWPPLSGHEAACAYCQCVRMRKSDVASSMARASRSCGPRDSGQV